MIVVLQIQFNGDFMKEIFCLRWEYNPPPSKLQGHYLPNPSLQLFAYLVLITFSLLVASTLGTKDLSLKQLK